MTLAEERVRVTRSERLLWQAWYNIEPWGEARADLRTATVACVIANSNRKKGAKAFTPKDFMPDFGAEPGKPKKTVKQMESVFSGFAELHNKAVRERKRRGG